MTSSPVTADVDDAQLPVNLAVSLSNPTGQSTHPPYRTVPSQGHLSSAPIYPSLFNPPQHPNQPKPISIHSPFFPLFEMRLPYVHVPTTSPSGSSTSTEAIIQRIRARRAPRPLQPLDLTLLHSPPIADGWNSFLAAIRTQTSLSADLRELAICRVAVVNRAWYEWMHHAPLAEQAGVGKEALGRDGVVRREGELRLVRGDGEGGYEKGEGKGKDGEADGKGVLTEKQWAVVCYTDEMTRNVQVREETFQRMRELFNEREIVEITATVACYNCVSRFLVALDVGERNAMGPDAAH
ncbi:hypothetical protein N656DRAFT_823217 [Canariomyces notabilis]|uniref:Carboxymuconolactone decarboxylase-like domain-containing protein n=1 Tax=Canariomyces notabilis TaxID=2074819 RepID=A0AAN6TGE6_9PEZI|nr:hypothetical protein N656DRAFT_823217 [Canariomyces arenarius]